ncbi:hypothetical protein IWQ56_007150, partial [Coemansia nantahalensis]
HTHCRQRGAVLASARGKAGRHEHACSGACPRPANRVARLCAGSRVAATCVQGRRPERRESRRVRPCHAVPPRGWAARPARRQPDRPARHRLGTRRAATTAVPGQAVCVCRYCAARQVPRAGWSGRRRVCRLGGRRPVAVDTGAHRAPALCPEHSVGRKDAGAGQGDGCRHRAGTWRA